MSKQLECLIILFQELVALQQKSLAQQNEMDRVRSDNVKLYEKIKFLQNYSGGGSSRGPREADDMEARYSAQYEQKLDPFTHFNKAVSYNQIYYVFLPLEPIVSMAKVLN